MINPVELISRSRIRRARIAASRVVITGFPLIALTVGLGAAVDPATRHVWQQWGYLIVPPHAALLRSAVFVGAGLGALVTAAAAWRAWREANDFEQAAARIDELIGAHQEVLTLAALANPARPEAKEGRSPLFAMLWRRAINYLERFDPQRAFPLEVAAALKRSSLLSAAAVVILGLAMLALMRVPSPVQAAAYRLRDFAANIAAPRTAGAEQLAAAARAVANDLENPRVPPPQKLAELESIKREIEKLQQASPKPESGSGRAQGSGSGAGSGAGEGTGGTGEGTGGGGTAKGNGPGAGGGGQGKKGDTQQLALKNDLAKAQAKLESEATSDSKSQTAQKPGQKGSGFVPQAGENPHHTGPEARPNGSDNVQLPEPGRLGQSQAPGSANNTAARKDDKGSHGDTHLGDFPKAVAYERFYKLGEKGPPIDLKDARYVTFRLPPAVVSGNGEGRLVHDSGAPAASTPYTNAPLKETRLVASPDEEQLVPPRYRDLIR